jgi:4-hydroxy-4-methyl-2-oxoglutarate aldolase
MNAETNRTEEGERLMPSRPYIVPKIVRADQDVVRQLGEHGVATVHESNARSGLMHGLTPVTPGMRVGGSAVTCLNFAGDNLMLFAALDLCEPGDVLVASVTSPSSHGMFGELLATSCRARGLAGVILDAGVRDTRLLREMGFPVWSRWVSSTGTEKQLPGWVNIPVSCGGVVVFPGDVIVADEDGVMVVERADAPGVLAAADAREAREEKLRARFSQGESSVDVGRMRARLDDLEHREQK